MARGRVTVRDIAREAGVSAASVSRAMNTPDSVSVRTRELVREAMERLDAANTARNAAAPAAIGCLFVDETSGPRFSGFDATIWSGIARSALTHGVDVVLLNPDRRRPGETLADLCASRNIGALAVRIDDASVPFLDEVAMVGVPSIVVAHRHEHPDLGYVRIRSRETSREAVEHLLRLGHRRIGFCRNLVSDQDHMDRRNGYLDALADAGIDHDPSLEVAVPADADGGVSAINRLLALPEPPTAVYFADPLPTIGGMRRLSELGLDVPTRFSVVGFDDDNARSLGTPVYSSVCQDAPGMARQVGRLLCRLMMGSNGMEMPRLELDSYLELNSSTGRPHFTPEISIGGAAQVSAG